MSHAGSYMNKKEHAPETMRQSALRLGFCTVHFGVLKEQLDDNTNSKTLMCRIAGREPKQSGDRVEIFMIGLKLIRYADRVKVGFFKRRQILEKA